MAGGPRMTHRQQAVIAALLTEQTQEAAAAKAGVPARTVRRWLQDPAFEAAYRSARREVLERTVARLLSLTGQALEALEGALNAKDTKDRIRAATVILDRALKGVETLDLAQQVEELRRQVEEARNVSSG